MDEKPPKKTQAFTAAQKESARARKALKALIERESARRLAHLGGSEPGLAAIPRRKSGPERSRLLLAHQNRASASGNLGLNMRAHRSSLSGFPDVLIHAPENQVKRHYAYAAAKSGDIEAADLLVADCMRSHVCQALIAVVGREPCLLVPVHALEGLGVNEIPAALARAIAAVTGWQILDSIIQINTVGHTGASGYHRLAHQALFAGEAPAGANCVIVDDFVGQGGTLANLHGFLRHAGANVRGATVLTGKPYSAKLSPEFTAIEELRRKYGSQLENWWREAFGFGFDALTGSEARYLLNSPDADTIRARIAQAGFTASNSPS